MHAAGMAHHFTQDYIMPLWLEMVPTNKTAVIVNLLNDIVVKHQTHLSTGILGKPFALQSVRMLICPSGTKYLLPTLSKLKRSDLALKLVRWTCL